MSRDAPEPQQRFVQKEEDNDLLQQVEKEETKIPMNIRRMETASSSMRPKTVGSQSLIF